MRCHLTTANPTPTGRRRCGNTGNRDENDRSIWKMSETVTKQKIDIAALRDTLAKATPGEWTVEMDGPIDDDLPCDVIIPEINRILHSTEWADPQDFGQDVANAHAIVGTYNAVPALLDELEALRALTTPEPIGEKHRDGNWWMVWAPGAESWFKCRWRSEFGEWQKGGTTEHLMSTPTHALPMPPEVKP
jgi:hypothetical protein